MKARALGLTIISARALKCKASLTSTMMESGIWGDDTLLNQIKDESTEFSWLRAAKWLGSPGMTPCQTSITRAARQMPLLPNFQFIVLDDFEGSLARDSSRVIDLPRIQGSATEATVEAGYGINYRGLHNKDVSSYARTSRSKERKL